MATLTATAALANSNRRHFLSLAGASVESVAAQIVGLHNTSPVTPHVSLLARLAKFKRQDLETLMWDSWTLARFRAMRLTMFVFPHDLLEIAAAATRHITEPLATRWLRDSGLSIQQYERFEAAVMDALSDGPMTSRQLRGTLGVPQEIELPGIVGRMCDKGLLVGGAPPRSWRSSVRQYHRWQDVLPTVDLQKWAPDAAVQELIHRYITTYGPVTVADISWWTGFTKARCRKALTKLNRDVEEVIVDGWPGPLYRLGGDPKDETLSDLKALPMLDPYIQGYRDRDRFLDAGRFHHVYDTGGNATATLIQRGRVIGVWQPVEKPTRAIRYHLFDRNQAAVRNSAETALDAVGRLYFDEPAEIVEVSEMDPLNAGGGRSAAHPLDSQLHRASRRRPE